MSDRRASLTAELAALARASHTKEPEPLRGVDEIAEQFLSPAFRFVVRHEPLRKLVRNVMARRMPGAYGYLVARTKVFDAFVRQELEAGATQLVVLGAGYDSRAYRFRELVEARGGKAFEVDAPATSRRKREVVARALGGLPAHVAYVEVDFDREGMRGPLLVAGYDPAARTVFTWEGVTFYISADAVDDVLRFVRESSAGGSGIVFDYLFRSAVDGRSDAFGARKTAASVRKRGEPFTFGIDEGEIGAFLEVRGLELEDAMQAAVLEERHLGGHAQRDVFRVGGFYGIATARVPRI